MRLNGVGEASIIGLFRHASETGTAGLLKGIGDDAAVFSNSQNTFWLLSSDLLIENVHFDLRTTTPYQLGFKCVAVNVSDIRAMNGQARYLLLSLALPAELDFSHAEDFAQGVREAERRFGVAVVGGDTCRSAAGLFISVTVVGHSGSPVYRSGAAPGDGLYVTGTLGDSSVGLEVLTRLKTRVQLDQPPEEGLSARLGVSCGEEHIVNVIRRHLMPQPVMTEPGSGISSMIDVSDGLLLDLDRLCTASGTGVRLNADAIPLSADSRAVCPQIGLNPLDLALRGGEDYELLFTAPEGTTVHGATRIGEILAEGREMVHGNRRVEWPKTIGYDHFG